jgi:lantibiotic biosynthesis protein
VDGSLTPVEAARHIAETLCASAEWRERQCTWADGLEPLGGDLYAGTAGVAWFLAGVARVTGDEPARRTALGAAEHSLAALAEQTAPQAGLHGGDLGAVWAAGKVGEWLERPDVTERARELAGVASRRLARDGGGRADVMSGLAGTALALVALGEQNLLVAIGEGLLTAAEPAPLGLTWPDAGIGLAHGAGGIAWALLELGRVTGDDVFRDAGLAGLAYERAWFDADACTWREPATGAVTGSSWCRGGTGAALLRLQALALAPDERLMAETGAALASVHGAVAAAFAAPRRGRSWEGANFSVCHGLMGAADTLLEASDALGVPEHRRAADCIAEHGLRTAEELGTWPCGTLDGSSAPGLMLGLAGIGAVLLRVAAPEALPPVGLLAYSTSAGGGAAASSG